jgi:hypothetical protein
LTKRSTKDGRPLFTWETTVSVTKSTVILPLVPTTSND